jgi:hypothetical protein
MNTGLRVAISYLVVTAVGTLLYWLDFFTTSRGRVRADPVYLAFERAFPLADAWMAACALMDVLFNLNEGNYSIASGAMTFEILINVVLLVGAPWLITWLWWNRTACLAADVDR